MHHRTLATGLTIAALAGGAIAVPADAATQRPHNVALSPTCTTVTLSGFRDLAAFPLADLTIRSDAGLHRTGPYDGPPVVAVPAGARGTVVASASDGYETWTSDACLLATAAAPAPGPAEPAAPGAPADSTTRRTEPMPRKEGKPQRPGRRANPPRRTSRHPKPPARTAGPAVWCRWLNRVNAGPERYRDRGLTFRCRIVKPTPRTVAVAGEWRR